MMMSWEMGHGCVGKPRGGLDLVWGPEIPHACCKRDLNSPPLQSVWAGLIRRTPQIQGRIIGPFSPAILPSLNRFSQDILLRMYKMGSDLPEAKLYERNVVVFIKRAALRHLFKNPALHLGCKAALPCPLPLQGVHPAFIGAQYPYSVTTPSLAATAVSFPGVPVPSMTQIAVHPYHAETGLPLSSNVASEYFCFNLLEMVGLLSSWKTLGSSA